MNTEKKKTSKGKKIIKWVVSILLVLIIGFVSIPFLFKDKIVQIVSNSINSSINASVTFKEVDLSLLQKFPLASITIADIAVVNKAPFVGDTLYSAKSLNFSMSIMELFKSEEEVIALKSIATQNGQVNIIFNSENLGNYDIAIPEETTTASPTNSSFSLDIQEYALQNMTFRYIDQSSNLIMKLENINHTGKGNFAKDILDLNTQSKANLSFDMGNVNYINSMAISLDAIIGIDLKNSKYTFKENKGIINQLPLEFDGFIQLVDENQVYDLNFKTPSSSFKNLLAILPKQYAGNLETITTTGNFDLKGVVKGVLSTNTIPEFDISFSSKNAMFQYDGLPKAVQNINIDARILNKTGYAKNTSINVEKLNFKIDEDVFSAYGNLYDFTTNPKIKLTAKGIINLANINKVYAGSLKTKLAGILKADVMTSFDMNSIEKGSYENIKNTGNISVTNFKYDGEEVANPFFINKTDVSFNTNKISLNEFDAKTGTSDINVQGILENFYGFLFNNDVLKGNFNLNSNNFKISDFLTEDEKEAETTSTASLKIPAFLDCKFTANAKKVVYDNITLNNVSGILYVKDEAVKLENLKSDVFGGKIGFDGNVSTKGKTSTFKMNLKLDELKIAESFTNLEMLKAIAPIAKTIEGKINSTIKVAGNLNEDMTPNLKTISGDLFGKLLNPSLKASNSKALSLLSNKVAFLDVNQLNLDGINAFLSFENGQVNVKPIPLKYKDIGLEISGNHSFDNKMNYDIIFDVPVKYLGAEVTSLLSKLSPKDASEVKSVPVKANLSGSFASPAFATNLQDATASLIKNLLEKQKQNLINKGKDKLTDLLGISNAPKDSTKTTNDKTKDKVKDVLGGLFGKKKKDTVKGKQE